jgi:hypothetical protein
VALAAIKTHRAAVAEQWLALGLPVPETVFTAATGERLTQDLVRSTLARIYKKPACATADRTLLSATRSPQLCSAQTCRSPTWLRSSVMAMRP